MAFALAAPPRFFCDAPWRAGGFRWRYSMAVFPGCPPPPPPHEALSGGFYFHRVDFVFIPPVGFPMRLFSAPFHPRRLPPARRLFAPGGLPGGFVFIPPVRHSIFLRPFAPYCVLRLKIPHPATCRDFSPPRPLSPFRDRRLCCGRFW